MKKALQVMLPIIIMVLVAVLCIVIYLVGTNQFDLMKILRNSEQNVVNVGEEVVGQEVILAYEELPRIDSAVITQPLVTSVVQNFTGDDSIQNSDFDFTDADEGIKKLINGEIDALISTYPQDELISSASARGVDLEITPIAKEGFVFLVNSANPVDNLKVSDVQRIYNGEITNWSQVGGNNDLIRAFQRPENTSTQNEMVRSVMKNLSMISPIMASFNDRIYGEVTDLIADYDNSNTSIGYAYLSEANILYDMDAKTDNTVKVLNINGVTPNYDTIKYEEYAFTTNFYLIRDKNNGSEQLEIFVNNLLSDRGKSAIREAGYIDE